MVKEMLFAYSQKADQGEQTFIFHVLLKLSFPMILADSRKIPLIFNTVPVVTAGYRLSRWFTLISDDFRLFPLIPADTRWFPLISRWFPPLMPALFQAESHWFPPIPADFCWFPLFWAEIQLRY